MLDLLIYEHPVRTPTLVQASELVHDRGAAEERAGLGPALHRPPAGVLGDQSTERVPVSGLEQADAALKRSAYPSDITR
jgi:hypothetical protein